MSEVTLEERLFRYVVVEGSPYEVGRQLAEAIHDDAGLVSRYTSGDPATVGQGWGGIEGLISLCDRYCPGLSEELRGFADSLGVDPARVLFYHVMTIVPPTDRRPACSHMAVLSSITQDGHVLVGRTDEGGLDMQDLCLVTERRAGAYAHLGFSIVLFGRSDGMNEHGLCVTTSAGGAYDTPATVAGVSDALVVRAVLDTCRTVDEALDLLRELTPVNTTNLILTDAGNYAALFEANNGDCAVKRIGPAGCVGPDGGADEAYLCSGNHATLPGMVEYNQYVNRYLLENSMTRVGVIRSRLEADQPRITKETLRDMLSTHIPEGLCAHFYHVGFGTVFQMIWDATAHTAEVCFGAPTHNSWRTVSLNDPVGVTRHSTIFPQPR